MTARKPKAAPTQKQSRPKPKPSRAASIRRTASASEANERIERVAYMLVRRFKKSQIKKYAKEQWGVGFRQVENYIRNARQWMMERADKSKDEFVAEALATYESIINNTEATNMDISQSQDAICRLLGLNAPAKVAPTTPDGERPYSPEEAERITAEMSSDELEVLHKIHDRMKNLATGHARSDN